MKRQRSTKGKAPVLSNQFVLTPTTTTTSSTAKQQLTAFSTPVTNVAPSAAGCLLIPPAPGRSTVNAVAAGVNDAFKDHMLDNVGTVLATVLARGEMSKSTKAVLQVVSEALGTITAGNGSSRGARKAGTATAFKRELQVWRQTPKAPSQPLPSDLAVHKGPARTAFAELQNMTPPAPPPPPPFKLGSGKRGTSTRAPDSAPKRSKADVNIKKSAKKGRKAPPPPTVPPPENGYEYRPYEAAKILLDPAHKGKAKGIVEGWRADSLVPASYPRIMAVKQECAQAETTAAANLLLGTPSPPIVDAGWHQMGPKPAAMPGEMRELARKINGTGISLSNKHIKSYLVDKRKAELTAAGKSLIGASLAPESRTVAGCKAMAATSSHASIGKATATTESRFTASNSLRNCASLAAATLVARTLPGVDPVQHADCSDAAAKGATQAQAFVQRFNAGVPVALVAPSLTSNLDDTCCFTFDGQGQLKVEDYTVSQQYGRSGADRSQSQSDFNDTSGKMGVRVYLTQGINAGGMAAPLCMSLRNLTERELPIEVCPNGVMVIPIAGLNLASGASLEALSSGTGYLVLLRKSSAVVADSGQSPEQIWMQHYVTKMYVPWMRRCRAFLGHEAADSPPPPHLSATMSSDGCGAQLRAMTNPAVVKILGDELVTATKSAAAGTSTQQALDVGVIFKLLKKYLKGDPGSGGLQNELMVRLVTKILTSTEGICLTAAKVKHVAAFCGRVPNIMAAAMTPANIKRSFEWCGQLVDADGGVSVEGCWATCLRSRYGFLSQTEEALLRDTLPELYEIMSENGYIAEADFDRLGFPQDLDSAGKSAPKVLSANQEGEERNKILNHHTQVALRAARVGSKAAVIAEKAVAAQQATAKHLGEADRALRSMVRAAKGGEWLAAAPPLAVVAAAAACEPVHVATVNSAALQSFIRVRMYRNWARRAPEETDWVWPKGKGTADAGTRCYVSEAHRLRNHPIVMEPPQSPVAVQLPEATAQDTTALPDLPQATVLPVQHIAGGNIA